MKETTYNLNWQQYNWRDFEKICFEYIRTIYSAKFFKTSLTKPQKDHGRDIIVKEKRGIFEAWGECKDHTRNVDLSVIGKNVVLALSHQINKAIFFSVSQITLNTKVEILNVAQKNQFDVLFLDGNELNQAIISCSKVAKKYFRNEYEKYIENNIDNIWIDTFLSEYPFAEDAKNNTKMQYHLENGFQVFLHVFIKNMGLQDISKTSFTLCGGNDAEVTFYEKEYLQTETISVHTDLLYTFQGLVFLPKKEIVLPHLAVEYFFPDGSKRLKYIELGTVDASDVWKAPYIHSGTIDFFADVSKVLQYVIPQKYTRILFLYGRSGMGKSRLISEIENIAYENAYRVIRLDFRAQEERFAMGALLMSLLNIPFSKTKFKADFKEFQKIFQERLDGDDIVLIYNFLNSSNEKIPFERLVRPIINLLVSISEKDALLLAMDNIQEISHDFQLMLWNILEHFRRISASICFIFTQNTERENQANNILVNYLQTNGEEKENYVIKHSCELLKEDDAILLLQELLHLTNDSRELLRALVQKIECCPMDILFFAKNLAQTPGLFTTVNSYKYFMGKIPSLEDNHMIISSDLVIKTRIENFIKDTHSPCVYVQIFSLIAFFEGNLPVLFLEKCGFDNNLLEISNRNLITKVNISTNSIMFYHDKIYTYIKSNSIGLSGELINKLTLNLSECYNKDIRHYYLYLKALIAQGEAKQAITLGLKALKKYKHTCENKYICKICDTLSPIINKDSDPVNYCYVIFIKADLLLERVNISEAEYLFEEIKEIINNKYTFFKPKTVIHFYHKYINQKIHTLQYEKAFEAIDNFKHIYGENTEISIIINDRLCVALYALGREKEALEAIKKVIHLAEIEQDYVWLSIAYSDKAFCHYYNNKDKELICSSFIQAVQYYEKSGDVTDISRNIEIQIQKTLISILENDNRKAVKCIQKSLQIAEDSAYGYLLIPALNIAAYLKIENENYEEANKLLEKALAYANTFSNPKAFVSIYNNLGNLYALWGKNKEALSYYLAALNTLKKICMPQNSFRYMGLLCNIVKLSFVLNKESILLEEMADYKFEDLYQYIHKCRICLENKNSLNRFTYGVLGHYGYDYLY